MILGLSMSSLLLRWIFSNSRSLSRILSGSTFAPTPAKLKWAVLTGEPRLLLGFPLPGSWPAAAPGTEDEEADSRGRSRERDLRE